MSNTINYLDRDDRHQFMDYSFPSAGWSDCHSNVAVSWPDDSLVGLQYFQSLRRHGAVVVTERLLGWSLSGEGKELPLKLVERATYPEKVVESSEADGIKIDTVYSWIERNSLVLEFKITNTTAAQREIELAFEYETKDQSENSLGGAWPRKRYEAGRRSYYGSGLRPMEAEDTGSWQTLIDFVKDPEAPYHDGYQVEGTAYPLHCLTKLEDRKLTLAPDEASSFSVLMTFGSKWKEVRQRYLRLSGTFESWSAETASERIAKLIDGAPEIDPDFAGKPEWERLYMQAICGLNSVYIEGENGYADDNRIPWTCKNTLAGGYFWDTAFSSAGGVFINAEAAKESIDAFCMNPNHRGAMPANLTDLYIGGEGQYPIMCWGAWNIYCTTKDKEWLEGIESSLSRHVEYWFKYHSRDNGICYHYNSALGADDCVRFDYCMKGLYNQPVYGIDSPDINAMFVNELNALAKINDELGNTEKAASFRKRAEKLGQQIIDLFYFPEHKMLLDTDEGTRNIKSGTITPHMFFPLWADVPLEESVIKEIIETHMLSPDTFNREHPFPSVAYNNPEYDPEGYWRGRIWPHMVFWMIQILWKHGYEKESNQVGYNMLNMMLKTPWICENYNSETGIGWSPETIRGWPGYNWCYSAVILLMSGKHKLPPLPEA